MYQTNIIRFLILVCLVQSSVWASEGSGTHGGDNVRLMFQEARVIAAKQVSLYAPQTTGKKTEIEQWLLTNKKDLAEDILKTPEYIWVDSVLSHEAMTRNEKAAPIQFSLPLCRLSYNRLEDAVNLLIHESIHHLGLTDEVLVNSIVIEIDKAKTEAFNFAQPAKMYLCDGKYMDRDYRVSIIYGKSERTTNIVGFLEYIKKQYATKYAMITSFNLMSHNGIPEVKDGLSISHFSAVDSVREKLSWETRARTRSVIVPETQEETITELDYAIPMTMRNGIFNFQWVTFFCRSIQ